MKSPYPYIHCFWRQDLWGVTEFKDVMRMVGFKPWPLVALVQGFLSLFKVLHCVVPQEVPSQKPTDAKAMVLNFTGSRTIS